VGALCAVVAIFGAVIGSLETTRLSLAGGLLAMLAAFEGGLEEPSG